MGLEERLPDEGFITTTLEYAVNWGRKYSIFPLTFGLACCAIEQITSGIARLRHQPFRLRGVPADRRARPTC